MSNQRFEIAFTIISVLSFANMFGSAWSANIIIEAVTRASHHQSVFATKVEALVA